MRCVASVTVWLAVGCFSFMPGPAALAQSDVKPPPSPPADPPEAALLFKTAPLTLRLASLGTTITTATVSDLAVADFNGDGSNDIAVAWYATDPQNMSRNKRVVSVFLGRGGDWQLATQITLYIPNFQIPALSIFRNGTAAMAAGDFDGDGDPDLAVTAFFGDELWLLENLGGGTFAPHLKFPFGFNSPANFITPPAAAAADFNGDGRDELVYIADPIQYLDSYIIHFWTTADAVTDMARTEWEGAATPFTQWTRGLAVADFDEDGRPDLCFTGTNRPPHEEGPILNVWYALDLATGRFSVRSEYPDIVCSDVVAVRPLDDCRPGLVLTDRDGATMQYWSPACQGPPRFHRAGDEKGFANLSPGRGMAAAVADLNGDGHPDIVTKQKLGGAMDRDQVELVRGRSPGGQPWWRVRPNPLDSRGFRCEPNNQILRPRNLAVADLFGNTRPEIVAGFAMALPALPEGERTLDVAIWANGCLGDVNQDGRVDVDDVLVLDAAIGACRPNPRYNPDADLDKSGCVTAEDRQLLISDRGCQCCGECAGQLLGDADCNGVVNSFDLDALILAVVEGEGRWRQVYGRPGCDYLCVNDMNNDKRVNQFDIDRFIAMLAYFGN